MAERIVSPGFRSRVYAVVREVPAGRVTTYGDVGAALGSPRVARQVGFALSALPADTDVPWQRVINARGRISSRGDTGRAELQRALLEEEGVRFDGDEVDLATHRWRFTPGTNDHDEAAG
jgi:methylated-DNA-protein-cysteine methyltransferase-like protein